MEKLNHRPEAATNREHSQSKLYARVPGDIKAPLLTELRSLKLRSIIKPFPAVLVIFSAIAILAELVKDHAILKLFEDYLPPQMTTASVVVAAVVLTVVLTGAALVYFLRQEYKDCALQECLYFSKCDAVLPKTK